MCDYVIYVLQALTQVFSAKNLKSHGKMKVIRQKYKSDELGNNLFCKTIFFLGVGVSVSLENLDGIKVFTNYWTAGV